jgi:hypothetical protein
MMKRLIELVFCALFLCHCGGQTMHHPSIILQQTGQSPRTHLKAMALLDDSVGLNDSEYQKILHRMLWAPGYTNQARIEALARLWSIDRENTIRTIYVNLPWMDIWSWQTELCKWIAENNVQELKEALIYSWTIPTLMVETEEDRPEYKALVEMYGTDAIVDLVFTSMRSSNSQLKERYRTRCWELLHRLDNRQKIIDLLQSAQISMNDSFLLDLRRSMNDLGIVPHRREEIFWIRELLQPEYTAFWNEAIRALAVLEEPRRRTLEMRDIPMVVSVNRHTPKYLQMTTASVLVEIEQKLKKRDHYYETKGGGVFSSSTELFRTHKKSLTWGDAMAITTALTAMTVPEVRAHLFDYALRDHRDVTTEYGGVIALDNKGRFEILEFEPKIRYHDRRYSAPQDLFDAAYTALFHFHFHAQKLRNGDHAGPGMGDKAYAQNTRANCLVFTFVNDMTMNVDFYRHGDVVVDLGTISLD